MDQQIKDLKDIINLIEVDTDLDLKRERLYNAQDIIDEMISDNDRKREKYFISINDIGPNNNFTRFYTVLGKMNREEAVHINKINSDYNTYSAGCNDSVREVSKETYDLWHALACYSEMLNISKQINISIQLSELQLDPIKQKISELRYRLGLNYEWQSVRLYR